MKMSMNSKFCIGFEKKFIEILIFVVIFSLSAILVWLFLPSLPPASFWFLLLVPAVVWFTIEIKINWKDKSRISKSVIIGILLVVFNLLINYNGVLQDIYIISSQYSLFFILANPIELLLISFFGGTAWFLHLPKKFNLLRSVIDVAMLASFGTVAELFILTQNDLMTYISVASIDPFFTYALVWSILHFVYYKILK